MEIAKSAPNIQAVKAFNDLSDASRTLLARGLRYVQCGKGAPILAKGERVSGAYVVLSGQLRVFTLSPDGTEATLYVINPHDLLYPAWVEAGSATRVAVIPGKVFKSLFEAEPTVRNMTVQAFSTIVFRLMAELEGIHSYKLERRLSNFLLLRASTDGIVRMTQQEIASHLGTSREVVARALGQLASAKRIRTGRTQIVINDPVTLAEHGQRRERQPSKTRR